MPVQQANPAPTQQETCGNYHEIEESELQAVPGVVGDGAETSISAMAAQGAHGRRVTLRVPAEHRSAAEPQGHGGAGQGPATRSRPRPSYVPPSQRRRRGELASLGAGSLALPSGPEQSPRGSSHAGQGGLPFLPPGRVGRLPTARTRERVSTEELDFSMVAGPGGLPLPPPGTGSTYAPPRRVGRLPTAPTIEGVEPDDISLGGLPMARTIERVSSLPAPRRRPRYIQVPRWSRPGKEAALYFKACCLLSCLALAFGFAVMVVYLRYHPQPPRMRVTTATLKNSTLGGGRATNCSLSIQAHIFNPNTNLHVVVRYVQLDLYFQGSLVGTQAVWPAPIYEAPGDSVRRSAHLSVNVTQEHDMSAWKSATNESGGIKPLVELLLIGRFYSQLNFGRRLPVRFWVYPRCTLWLDPLRGGALRQSWC